MAISRMQRFLTASVSVYGARGYRTIVGAGAVSSLLSQRVKGTGRLGMPCAHSPSGVRCCISPAFANAMTHAVRWQSSSRATDYYTLLGVKPDASADEIKASYKKLVFQYHPDRNKDPGAEEMFKSISEAYRVIGNKERRREYDMRRGSASSFSNTTSGGGFPSDHSQGTPWGYQQMSKEDADRLFRDLFGGMRVDQIFRDFEEEMRRSNVRSGQGRAQSEFSEDERAFRPFFRSGSTRVFTDSHGNRMEEREFTDARGTTFKVRTVTSEQANGSTNQKAEDFYNTKAGASRDGRFRYGNSSFKVNPRDFTNDFGQAALGMRTHGRHPLVAMLMLAAWGTIIGTFVFVGFSFFLSHPLFTTAVLLLLFLRRFRIF